MTPIELAAGAGGARWRLLWVVVPQPVVTECEHVIVIIAVVVVQAAPGVPSLQHEANASCV
jgi:hypothetical protein